MRAIAGTYIAHDPGLAGRAREQVLERICTTSKPISIASAVCSRSARGLDFDQDFVSPQEPLPESEKAACSTYPLARPSRVILARGRRLGAFRISRDDGKG